MARFRQALEELPLTRRRPGRPTGGNLGRNAAEAVAIYRDKRRILGREPTAQELSDLLGYAEPSSMRRALRRIGMRWAELAAA